MRKKKNMKNSKLRWENDSQMLAASKVKMSGSEKKNGT